jgi:hypothetical protein
LARYTYKHFHYLCSKCENTSSILKEVGDTERDETCRTCENPLTIADRVTQNSNKASNYAIIGAKVESAEYNPGLGTVTKSKNHRNEIAKRMGAVEIGNDYKSADAMSKEFDKSRAEKIERNWEKD